MRAVALKTTKTAHFIGVDEAGRGPLAGPVAVGVVSIPTHFPLSFFEGIRDSKELSEEAREAWALKAQAALSLGLHYSVCFSSSMQIDRLGIVAAVEEASAKALAALDVRLKRACVFLDGALAAPEGAGQCKVSVRGDVCEPLVSLASILAKVYRDSAMERFSRRYPEYGFERHRGYGTPEHYAAIREHGLCAIHRRSFVTLELSS